MEDFTSQNADVRLFQYRWENGTDCLADYRTKSLMLLFYPHLCKFDYGNVWILLWVFLYKSQIRTRYYRVGYRCAVHPLEISLGRLSQRWHVLKAFLSALMMLIIAFQCQPAWAATRTGSDTSFAARDDLARLTEAKGDVYKRGFVDWNKDEWGDPLPATKGDSLHEGMQVGTGDRSWAQVSWTNVDARAWANSVYALAPNQRLVYLLNGEMLVKLSKKRNKKDPYYVWTNLIQARMRGTTVLMQTTATVSRITVLEGTIDVLNRHDRSIVRLTPGVVYEVRASGALEKKLTARFKNAVQGRGMSADRASYGDISSVAGNTHSSGNANATPLLLLPQAGGQLTSIVEGVHQSLPLFKTTSTVTTLLVASVSNLLSHPLLTGFTDTLSSLPLIETSLGQVTGILAEPTGSASILPLSDGKPLPGGISHQTDKLLGQAAQVLTVPQTVAYSIGPDAGKVLSLPQTIASFPPQGIIGQEMPITEKTIDNIIGSTALLNPVELEQLVPYTPATISASLPGGGEVAGGALSILATPGIAARAGLLGGAGGTGILGGVTGSTAGLVGTLGVTVGGVLGGLGGTVGGLGGTVGGLPGGALGGVGGALGGLGGTIGGLGGLGGGLFP